VLHNIGPERPARDKRSSLSEPLVSYEEYEVLWIQPLFGSANIRLTLKTVKVKNSKITAIGDEQKAYSVDTCGQCYETFLSVINNFL